MLEQMKKHEEALKEKAEKLQQELAETINEISAISRAIQAYRIPNKRQGGRLAVPKPPQTMSAMSQKRSEAGRKGSRERWRRFHEAKDAKAAETQSH